jgi:hypothetical protein
LQQSITWLQVHQKLVKKEEFCSKSGLLFMLDYGIRHWVGKFKLEETSQGGARFNTYENASSRTIVQLWKEKLYGLPIITLTDSDIFSRFVIAKYSQMYE